MTYTIFETPIGIVKHRGKLAFDTVLGDWSPAEENECMVAGNHIATAFKLTRPREERSAALPKGSAEEFTPTPRPLNLR